ncbi:hypothetical protein HAX54_006485, partial [Datura stramonium]|nr:hypothetical protein [Datura stramonium]
LLGMAQRCRKQMLHKLLSCAAAQHGTTMNAYIERHGMTFDAPLCSLTRPCCGSA